MEETITLKVDKSAALVLLDFLWRWQIKGLGKTLVIKDDAEWHALGVIQGSLEAELSEPFRSDYDELVREAQYKLVEHYGRLGDYSFTEKQQKQTRISPHFRARFRLDPVASLAQLCGSASRIHICYCDRPFPAN